jgi:hypothetical protein
MGTFTATWNYYDRKTDNQQYTGNFTTVIKLKNTVKLLMLKRSRHRPGTVFEPLLPVPSFFCKMIQTVTDSYLTFTEHSIPVGSDRLYPLQAIP